LHKKLEGTSFAGMSSDWPNALTASIVVCHLDVGENQVKLSVRHRALGGWDKNRGQVQVQKDMDTSAGNTAKRQRDKEGMRHAHDLQDALVRDKSTLQPMAGGWQNALRGDRVDFIQLSNKMDNGKYSVFLRSNTKSLLSSSN
jgi:hypothetical protein